MSKKFFGGIAIIAVVVLAAVAFLFKGQLPFGDSATDPTPLKVGIAPYQDMAMLAAAEPQGINDRHGLNLELVSMQWADLTPAVASAAGSVDVAFASMIQFISQDATLNAETKDPLVFFYPAYIFRGGAFVTFNPDVPIITKDRLDDKATIAAFLDYKFAVQSTSSYEILLHDLASRAGIAFSDVERFDIDSSDGLLAAINGAVDIAAAGLTQKNDALKKGGRVVLEMEALGQVDVAGFIAKRSTLQNRSDDVRRLLRVWVDSIDYVMSDIENNSVHSLAYLKEQSSTNYTFEEYRAALKQEWLPTSIEAIHREVVSAGGQYYYEPIIRSVSSYYLDNDLIPKAPENIEFIEITP